MQKLIQNRSNTIKVKIKTPKIKTWHQIKCPKCGFVINLFCGEEGELLTMNHIRDMYDAK